MTKDARPAQKSHQATERLAAVESELSAVYQELDHTHRLTTLGALTAGIAHEVNNLLTPALAYAQLAQTRPEDATLQRKALDKAIDGIEASSRVLRTVLDFSSAGPDDLPAHVASVLDASVDCLGRSVMGGRIRLIKDIDPDLHVVMGPLPLQQTLLNLLLNACRALHETGGQISVIAKIDRDTQDEGGNDDIATIAVVDNGPGIPEEIRETLFEPFVSGDQGSEGARRGSGLGLAICRRAVDAVGGTIEADATPGGGATFVLTLPVPSDASANTA